MKAKEAKKGGRYQKVVYLVGEKERGGASAVGKHGHAHIKGGGSIFESLHSLELVRQDGSTEGRKG